MPGLGNNAASPGALAESVGVNRSREDPLLRVKFVHSNETLEDVGMHSEEKAP